MTNTVSKVKNFLQRLSWRCFGVLAQKKIHSRVNLSLLELFLVIAFLAGNVGFVMFAHKKFMTDKLDQNLKQLGHRMGALVQWVTLLVLLPVTKNSVLNFVFGCSFERVIKYHRWVSRYNLFILLVHLALMCTRITLHSSFAEFLKKSREPQMILGYFATAAGILLFVTSLPFFRRRYFELFYKSHIVLFVCFIAGACLHYKRVDMVLKVAVPLGLYFIDWVARVYLVSAKSARIISFEMFGDDVLSLKIHKPGFKYESGQYVFLGVPKVAFLQFHPFTISSSPREFCSRKQQQHNAGTFVDLPHLDENIQECDCEDDTHHCSSVFTIVIKARGEFTKKLISGFASGELNTTSKILVDGPYGSLSIPLLSNKKSDCYPVIFLACGGIGITPMVSLLKSLHQLHKNSIVPVHKRVVFVWSVRNVDEIRCFEEMLCDIADDFPAVFDVRVYFTKKRADHDDSLLVNTDISTSVGEAYEQYAHDANCKRNNCFRVMYGRPNFNSIFNELSKESTGRVGVGVCGPEVMLSTINQLCQQYRFDMHAETFKL